MKRGKRSQSASPFILPPASRSYGWNSTAVMVKLALPLSLLNVSASGNPTFGATHMSHTTTPFFRTTPCDPCTPAPEQLPSTLKSTVSPLCVWLHPEPGTHCCPANMNPRAGLNSSIPAGPRLISCIGEIIGCPGAKISVPEPWSAPSDQTTLTWMLEPLFEASSV